MSTGKHRIPVRLDVVADIGHSWSLIGWLALQKALLAVKEEIVGVVTFQPFELARDVGPAGETLAASLARRQDWSYAQVTQAEANAQARGRGFGLNLHVNPDRVLHRTFDAHRLVAWAGHTGAAGPLFVALGKAALEDGADLSSHQVLVTAASRVGLDADGAAALLAGQRFAREVRERQDYYRARQVLTMPTLVVDERHLIVGAQPVEVFEEQLRRMATMPR